MPPWIPSYQTLGTRSGWRRQRRGELPFPLAHDRVQTYYLGRGAVYFGAKALGLGSGDEIVFPAYHSGTESAPLLHLGCRLKYYGVRANWDIDPDEVEAAMGPETKAIYVIHYFGFPAPIAALREIDDRYFLPLIEDVALSFLAHGDGRPLGAWGDVSIFCPYKSVPTAAGGILAINRADVPLPPPPRRRSLYSELNLTTKRFLSHLELHGGFFGRGIKKLIEWPARLAVKSARLAVNTPDALDFDPSLLEWNMGPITRRLLGWFDYDEIARRRRENYRWLVEQLRGTDVRVLREDLPAGTVPLFLPILVRDKFPTVARLKQQAIEAVPVWGTHHEHVPRGEFPEAEFLIDHVVEIPAYQDLTRPQLARIRDALVHFAAWPGFRDTNSRATSLPRPAVAAL